MRSCGEKKKMSLYIACKFVMKIQTHFWYCFEWPRQKSAWWSFRAQHFDSV